MSESLSARNDALFAEVCRKHLGIVARTASAFASDRADRDDLGQEILIALWQALPQFNAQSKLPTYVYRVAQNCALNWKRSDGRYRKKLERYLPEVADPTVSGSVRDQERLRWLYARIHELRPVDRTLILLSLDRIAYDEISEITGLTEGNVGVRLHRIKQQLIAQSEMLKDEL